jgi:hypothetical protein
MILEVPDGFTRLYLYEYPKGHPNGPWEATVLFEDQKFWCKGFGPTPEEALKNLRNMGKPSPVTGGIAPRPTLSRVEIAGLDLDL